MNIAREREDVPRGSELAVARTLGLAELHRLAIHPLVAVGIALSGVATFLVTGLRGGVLFRDDALLGLLMFPLAGMTLIGVNLSVLRGRRHDVEELFESLPTQAYVRTTASAISLLAPATYAVVLSVGACVAGRLAGGIGWPHPAEIGIGAVLVLAAGLVGILLARIIPRSAAAPFIVAGIGIMEITMATTNHFQWNRLAPFMSMTDEPAELWFHPREAHLVYLLGICAVLFSSALLIRRRSRRAFGILLVGLAVAVAGAVAQSPKPTASDEVRFAAWVEHPESMQRCRSFDSVRYCAYADYHQLVERWRAPVEGVLRLLPTSARARALLIQQRLPSGVVRQLRPSLRSALSFQAGANIRFWWPDDGAIHPDLQLCVSRFDLPTCEVFLGNMVASWAVGLPLVRSGPPVDGSQAQDGRQPLDTILNSGLYDSSGQARAVVALWLTIESTPRTRAVVTRDLDTMVIRYPMNLCSVVGEGPEPAVTWSLLDTGYARRLAERPIAEVAARLHARWDLVTDPHTTSDQLAAMFGLERPTAEMRRTLVPVQPVC